MDVPSLPEQPSSTSNLGISSLQVLLRRGLDYLQQGCEAEGVALLAVVYEQLPPDQMQVSEALKPFLQAYTQYQCAWQALREASRHFAQIDAEQSLRVVALEKACSTLLSQINSAGQATQQNPRTVQHYPSASLPLHPPPEDFPTVMPQTSAQSKRMLPELSITCLGRFEIRRQGQPVALCSNRCAQTILRYLAVQAGHSASAEKLMGVAWPEDEPEVAQNKLHIAISALRRSLHHGLSGEYGSGYIICKNHSYSLNPLATIHSDTDDFLRLYQLGQQSSAERIICYEQACSLYIGLLLPDDLYADWSFLLREQFRHIHLAMCRVLSEHYLQLCHYEKAITWATAILGEDRCDEAAHRRLMQIYAAQGRRSEAFQQYQRCVRILQQELGVQPLPETNQFFQTLLAGDLVTQTTAEL